MTLSRKIRVLFDIVQEYYWPSMEPVIKAYAADERYELFLKAGPNQKRRFGILLVSRQSEVEQLYLGRGYKITRDDSGFDIVFCGDTLKNPSRYGNALLVNLDHGPCIKTLRYRNLLKQPETQYVVCAEGPYRVKKLTEYGLDKRETVIMEGFPKLDTFFNGTYSRDEVVKRHSLDPAKSIVLYAPTYKPTSIPMVAKGLPDVLDRYNVVVKLHPYSWNGKYAPHEQHRVFERLAKRHPNLHLVPPDIHDIMPYLFAADTMISEASSVINEFLALGRCGIIYDIDDNQCHSDGEPHLAEKASAWLTGAFVHVDSPEGIARAIEEALNPSDIRRVELTNAKNFIYVNADGTAASKVKAKIENFMNESGRST